MLARCAIEQFLGMAEHILISPAWAAAWQQTQVFFTLVCFAFIVFGQPMCFMLSFFPRDDNRAAISTFPHLH